MVRLYLKIKITPKQHKKRKSLVSQWDCVMPILLSAIPSINKSSNFSGFATENTLSDLKLAAGTGKMTLTPCSPHLQWVH